MIEYSHYQAFVYTLCARWYYWLASLIERRLDIATPEDSSHINEQRLICKVPADTYPVAYKYLNMEVDMLIVSPSSRPVCIMTKSVAIRDRLREAT